MIFFCLNNYCSGQHINYDSLQTARVTMKKLDAMELALAEMPRDTACASYLGNLSYYFAFNSGNKSVRYGQEGITLSKKLNYKKGIAHCSQSLAMGYWLIGNYSAAQELAFNAVRLYEEMGDSEGVAFSHFIMANIYRDFGDYKRAMAEAKKGHEIYRNLLSSDYIGKAIIASIYDLQDSLDLAELSIDESIQESKNNNKAVWGWTYLIKGNICRKKKRYDLSLFYYDQALKDVHCKDSMETYNGMARLYQETRKIDSSNFFASEVLRKWQSVGYQRGIYQSVNILAENYKKLGDKDRYIYYLEQASELNNSIYGQQSEREIQNMAFNEHMRQEEVKREKEGYRTLVKIYALIAAGFVFLLIAIILWRNNRQKQHAKNRIEKAYADLKAAQSQLIQSEKMASLGELTAGIAHEIQNPLNFVNNFSEINAELADEILAAAKKGDLEEILQLAGDIKNNQDKISEHGKRADAIVKGMLQHSRSSGGVKEPANINRLADEYFRLAYHACLSGSQGLRTKDTTFSVTLKTDLDSTIGEIPAVSQDIGRVLLNVYNNAFYTVAEKKSRYPAGYEPEVSVRTRRMGDRIEISVRDNGMGIPQKVLDKIFQPFFTTKPTGKGTGLGLSLSYDIVKAHGGELRVETSEGVGSVFIIELPVEITPV
jgi:signal transduction histidine kinase